VIDLEPAAGQEAPDTPIDGGEEPRHLLLARRLGGMELEDAVVAPGEDAVEHEGVERT